MNHNYFILFNKCSKLYYILNTLIYYLYNAEKWVLQSAKYKDLK